MGNKYIGMRLTFLFSFFLVGFFFAGCISLEVTQSQAEQAWREFGGMEMVGIPAGTYVMGSDNDLDFGASPPHHVTLSYGYYMGKYLVTRGQFQKVMGYDPNVIVNNSMYFEYGNAFNRRPQRYISWFDAVEFCNKLSEIEGLTPVYTIAYRDPIQGYPIIDAEITANWNANGYRLPTEAEWEYACRAGTATAYNTGESINEDIGWYRDSIVDIRYDAGHDVGLKPPNAWGLYDINGNLWEWCWDWAGEYSGDMQTNPTGAISGDSRVIRGGWAFSEEKVLRSAYRASRNPANYRVSAWNGNPGGGSVGFRVVRLNSPDIFN